MTIKSILHLAALFLGENRLLDSGVFNDNVSVEKSRLSSLPTAIFSSSSNVQIP